MQQSIALIKQYYQAFNDADMETFFSLLAEDVIHDINQGSRELGKAAFVELMKKMNHHYCEQLVDMVVMANEEGSRGTAEFMVLGK